ncbi:flagellar hook-associated protein FlgK [Azohydromonas lata]|uniref:Flagellar hook-associated protein 1 n=1 Tax=Azohydromonas lata TaxID=45677 RepID=A0ABU5IEL3_9BURK|nr:flagellar hook-associated protein FlgK [Azohydromonas lata]MDZ5457269.1 flagellar hook-associated protein FlgK [Azohydromonas lata]
MAFSLLSVGARAMSANYAALQTTGNNIANANVAGYSRQEVEFSTANGQYTPSGFIGQGVDVTTISRAHDAFLTREVSAAQSQAAADSTRLDLLSQMENAFPTGDSGVGAAASSLLGAFTDLSTSPGDASARQVVLSRADQLAQRFANAGEQLNALQDGVVKDLRTAINGANGITSGIAQLNAQIVRQQAQGQPPNDLLDKRDQLVQQLSGYLQVSTVAAPDGSIGVFAAGGQSLVLGDQVQKLEVTADRMDGSRAALGVRQGNGMLVTLDSTALSGGGSMGAMLRFQNQDLVAARNSLGQMATAVSARMNQQQALGLDLRSPAGSGQPLFTDFMSQSQAGALRGLADVGNARDGSGNALGSVEIHIDDASLLEAAEYTLEGAAGGGYVMTRTSDGQRFSTADGQSFTREGAAAGSDASFHPGFTLNIEGVSAGDRFLLQPVGGAAANMRRVLDDPRGLAAAAPLTASPQRTNTGTATVSALTMTGSGFDASHSVQGSLSFTDDGGAYEYKWDELDASGAVVGSNTLTGTWQAGQPIALEGFSLTLAGRPAKGDSIAVATTTNPATNNGNARALAGLGTESFIGRNWSAAGSTGGDTITNAYAGALANVGSRVQVARTASEISDGVATNALAQRDAKTGVDTDEEGAKLIQYQKSYQAAAKVLQVAQTVFDALLQATSR